MANIPKKATIEEGKFLTWGHFGPSVRISVYNYVYASKPYFYHFWDKTGENNWLIDAEATEYLLEVGSYYKKTGNGINPMEFLQGYQSRNLKKNNTKKLYIKEPNSENPYYYPILGTDKNYAGKASTSQASSKYIAPPPSSSTKVRDARHADKVVAKEEACAKAEASMAKPRDLPSKASGTANEKLKPRARPKPRPRPKRCIESDNKSSDNEGSKLVSRPARSDAALLAPSSPIPTNNKGRSDCKPAGGTQPRKKLNQAPQKSPARTTAGTQDPDRNDDEPDEETTETKSNVASKRSKVDAGLKESHKRAVSHEEEVVEEEDEEEGVDEEQRGGKGTKLTPTQLLPGPDDPSSIGSQPLVDGMRVIKSTRMMVKIPTSGAVASRTRQKAK